MNQLDFYRRLDYFQLSLFETALRCFFSGDISTPSFYRVIHGRNVFIKVKDIVHFDREGAVAPQPFKDGDDIIAILESIVCRSFIEEYPEVVEFVCYDSSVLRIDPELCPIGMDLSHAFFLLDFDIHNIRWELVAEVNKGPIVSLSEDKDREQLERNKDSELWRTFTYSENIAARSQLQWIDYLYLDRFRSLL